LPWTCAAELEALALPGHDALEIGEPRSTARLGLVVGAIACASVILFGQVFSGSRAKVPQVAASASRRAPQVLAPAPSPKKPLAPARVWWAGCCCSRPGATGLAGEASTLLPALDEDDREPWLIGARVHPKFCGLRYESPPAGELPNMKRFAEEPAELTAAPDAWEALLPCSDDERRLCRELRARVAGTPGLKDPVTMLRFLRARKNRVEAAADMYSKAMTWRRSVGLELGFRTATLDDSLHRRLDAYWPPTAILGRDRDGDAVYWNRMGLGSTDFLAEVPTEFIGRHEVYTITRIMQALEEHSTREGRPSMYMTVVVDLADFRMRNTNIKALPKYKACVRIMEDNFPEMVKRIVVVRAPTVFYTVWRLLSKCFDEGTRSKIQIVDERNTLETLSKLVDPAWIPEALGGSCRVAGSLYCEPCIPGPGALSVPPELLEDIQRESADPGGHAT